MSGRVNVPILSGLPSCSHGGSLPSYHTTSLSLCLHHLGVLGQPSQPDNLFLCSMPVGRHELHSDHVSGNYSSAMRLTTCSLAAMIRYVVELPRSCHSVAGRRFIMARRLSLVLSLSPSLSRPLALSLWPSRSTCVFLSPPPPRIAHYFWWATVSMYLEVMSTCQCKHYHL